MHTSKVVFLGLFYLLGCFFSTQSVAAEPKNLAVAAKASAWLGGPAGEGTFYWAEEASGNTPGYVVDSDLDTAWGFPWQPPADAWLDLTWPKPVAFREVLIRQSLRGHLLRLALQVKHDGQWETVKTMGEGNTLLPKLILITTDAETTDVLRLTSFGGIPNFYEVEVYEGPNPPVINLAGDAAGHILGIVTNAFGAGPAGNAPLSISGRTGNKDWKATGSSDEHDMFSIAAPTGARGPGASGRASRFCLGREQRGCE
jgi:hypothetical protein